MKTMHQCSEIIVAKRVIMDCLVSSGTIYYTAEICCCTEKDVM